MENSENGSNLQLNSDIGNRAREIFIEMMGFRESEAVKGVLIWRRLPSNDVSGESIDSAGVSHQHLISSVSFRSVKKEQRNDWELEHLWDSVDIRRLRDIGPAYYEYYHMNYTGQRQVMSALTENVNIVLMRNILDWSRPDGNVWSQQIVWTGSFADSQRMMQHLDSNSPSLLLVGQYFDQHSHLRRQYIARHRDHPMAAAISALLSSPIVSISNEMAQRGEGGDESEGHGLICAICLNALSTGESAAKLGCNHFYHENCILPWFYRRLTCPLCRNECK